MKSIVFDMDGTLINSGADITTSVNYVRNTVYNLPHVSVEYVTEAINRDQRNLALLFYGVPVYEKRAQQIFEMHYHEQCVQTVRLYDGIGELLAELAHRKVQMAVATNAPTPFALKMLDKLSITDAFTHIIGSNDVQHPKPDPEMIHRILDDHHCTTTRNDALIVGDSEKDMEAGRRAGIATAFASWGFSPQGNGDFICNRPADILAIIEAGST
jgi:phosphoglycolate phosphatase